jgi:pilus assembly protein CpaF
VVSLEARPANVEGRGEVTVRELVRNALRMRPDRIIVGEVRGGEALDMLQAMNTGHEGSLTTIHANSPRDAIARLEQMISMTGLRMSQSSVRAQIASAIRLVVQLQRLSDGTRRVVSVSEIVGMEGDVIQMQTIYEFVRLATDGEGSVRGEFRATGVRPKFLDQLKLVGINIPIDAFDPARPL